MKRIGIAFLLVGLIVGVAYAALTTEQNMVAKHYVRYISDDTVFAPSEIQDFMILTKAEQIALVQAWAQDEVDNIQARIDWHTAEIATLTTKKADYQQALSDWAL